MLDILHTVKYLLDGPSSYFICLISSNTFANSLIWSTGNDYYNTCSNLNSYNYEQCLNVSSAYFDATLNAISTIYFINIYHINEDCFEKNYEFNKITAQDAHNMIIGYLKNHPDYRSFRLSRNFYMMFWENYPPPKECETTKKK